MWSLGWVAAIRLILYLVIVAFFIQHIYFGERNLFHQPYQAIVEIFFSFCATLFILIFIAKGNRTEQAIAFVYCIDLIVITRVIMASGGLNSVFIPYYLPVLVMATAWLPRRFTAIFPSLATLGLSYIGFAHLVVALKMPDMADFYPEGVLSMLRLMQPHTVVSTMLILTVAFFVISYLSAMISERLFIEQRLNAEVLASMSEGVAVVRISGQLFYVNSEFQRIFPGVQPGGDFALVAAEIFPEARGHDLWFSQALARNPSHALTLLPPAVPGRPPIEIRVSGVRLRGSKELFGLLFLVSDLTLRRRMEQAERGLERFSSISTMAAGLAHEIRNPLASLRSAIQEIGRSFPQGSEHRILTDVVIAESDRLDGVIGRFLDFSRESRLRLGKRRLGGLLKDVQTMVTRAAEGRDVEVTLDIREDPVVCCDSDRMMEVCFNLALNATQAVPHPGGTLHITLEQHNKLGQPGIEILFEDNGRGIAANDLPRLFEPFFTRRANGTGMGLAISRKQVNMHGGDLDADNRPEGGACFRIWLPLEQAKSEVDTAQSMRGTRVLRRVE